MKFKKAALSLLLTTAFVISATGCSSKETAETELDAETTAVEKEITTEEDLVAKEAEADEYYEAGRIALYGLDGTEINLTVAYENFVKAVELGNVDANFYLGVLYDWYNYPEKNFEVAKSYYEKCENNPYADISLGFLYWNGQGVEEWLDGAKTVVSLFFPFSEAVRAPHRKSCGDIPFEWLYARVEGQALLDDIMRKTREALSSRGIGAVVHFG